MLVLGQHALIIHTLTHVAWLLFADVNAIRARYWKAAPGCSWFLLSITPPESDLFAYRLFFDFRMFVAVVCSCLQHVFGNCAADAAVCVLLCVPPVFEKM